MDYRDILGIPKKQSKKKNQKKIIHESPKPSITNELEKQFGSLNEWSSKPPTEKRWSKKFNGSQGLTEFEQRGGKDKVNEGPAYDYAQQWDNVKKTYGAFWDSVHDLEDLLQSKGMGRDAKKVNQMYKKNVEGFYKFIYKLIGKLM
jgi:hypothetical protein